MSCGIAWQARQAADASPLPAPADGLPAYLSPQAAQLLVGVSVYREPVGRNAVLFQVGELGPGEDGPAAGPAPENMPLGAPVHAPSAAPVLGTGPALAPRAPYQPPQNLAGLVSECEVTGLLTVSKMPRGQSRAAGDIPPVIVEPRTAAALHRELLATGRGAEVTRAHQQAAEYWQWRATAWPQDQDADVHDLLEARYHQQQAGGSRQAIALTEMICSQLHAWGQLDREAALIRETMAWLPARSPQRASWIQEIGRIAQVRGDYTEARRRYQQALEIYARAGDASGVSRSHHLLGVLAQAQGDYAEAERRYQQSASPEVPSAPAQARKAGLGRRGSPGGPRRGKALARRAARGSPPAAHQRARGPGAPDPPSPGPGLDGSGSPEKASLAPAGAGSAGTRLPKRTPGKGRPNQDTSQGQPGPDRAGQDQKPRPGTTKDGTGPGQDQPQQDPAGNEQTGKRQPAQGQAFGGPFQGGPFPGSPFPGGPAFTGESHAGQPGPGMPYAGSPTLGGSPRSGKPGADQPGQRPGRASKARSGQAFTGQSRASQPYPGKTRPGPDRTGRPGAGQIQPGRAGTTSAGPASPAGDADLADQAGLASPAGLAGPADLTGQAAQAGLASPDSPATSPDGLAARQSRTAADATGLSTPPAGSAAGTGGRDDAAAEHPAEQPESRSGGPGLGWGRLILAGAATLAAAAALVAGIVTGALPGPQGAHPKDHGTSSHPSAGQNGAGGQNSAAQNSAAQNSAAQNGAAGQAPADSAALVRAQTAAWAVHNLSGSDVVFCDAAMCSVLLKAGFPEGNMVTANPASDLNAGDVIIATEALRRMFGARLTGVFAPDVEAAIGSGSVGIQVRVVAPNGAAAYRNALRLDVSLRRHAGIALASNHSITAAPAARHDLTTGQVDSRLLTILPPLANAQPVHILGFGADPGASPGMPLRSMDISLPVPRTGHGPPGGRLHSALVYLATQQPPYLAMSERVIRRPGQQPVLRIEFGGPAPLGLLDGGSLDSMP